MVEVVTVRRVDPTRATVPVERLRSRYSRRQTDLERVVEDALQGRNIPHYTETVTASNVADAILQEIETHGDVRLLLLGWPGKVAPEQVADHPLARIVTEARTDVAAFLDRGTHEIRRVLVPFGGGVHARLAVRTALQLVDPARGEVVVLRCFINLRPEERSRDLEEGESASPIEDEFLLLREELEGTLGAVPENVRFKVINEPGLLRGILAELNASAFDLVVMGAGVARSLNTEFFGSITDAVAEQIPVSVLMVRHYEPHAMGWIRRQFKALTPVSGRHRALAGADSPAGADNPAVRDMPDG